MADLEKAIAAHREALARYKAAFFGAEPEEDAHKALYPTGCALVAALDAAQAPPAAAVPDEYVVDPALCTDDEHLAAEQAHARGWNACRAAMLKQAPPAAAVPEGYVQVPVNSLRWWRELAQINPADLVPRIDAMLAAERKGGES